MENSVAEYVEELFQAELLELLKTLLEYDV